MMNIFEFIQKEKPLLIKITESKYVDDFIKGNFYMNSVHYFRTIEDKGGEMRKDFCEGYAKIVQPSEFHYLYHPNALPDGSEWKMSSQHLIGGVLRDPFYFEHGKIFCFYEIKYNQNKMEIEPIDNRILDFGDAFICITNVMEFTKRINRAIGEKQDVLMPQANFYRVEYYNDNEFSGTLGPLRKRMKYKWQNEFRLYVELKEKHTKQYILPIGDISDITITGNSKRMVDNIRFIDKDKIFFAK